MGLNVIALGGNAILDKIPTDDGQKAVVAKAAAAIVNFIKSGEKVVICHGNGPQVGNLMIQQKAGDSKKTPMMKLDTVVAMTEGSIGYWLQQALQNELRIQQMSQEVISLVTQVVVDLTDPSFSDPSKPIGPFYTPEEAAELADGEQVFVEDAGRGFRRVVASPKPLRIVEKKAITKLLEADIVPICAGGGGIPVSDSKGQYQGVEAVIDKDFSASLLARSIEADRLIILTGVDNIYINFNQPNQQALSKITKEQAQHYIDEQQFGKGSMLPKIKAAIDFVADGKKREVVITSMDQLAEIFAGAGTRITN